MSSDEKPNYMEWFKITPLDVVQLVANNVTRCLKTVLKLAAR